MSGALAWAGIGLCGALGAYARFRVGVAVTARRPSDFPFGTFVVNLSGGFALGLLTGLSVGGDALFILGTGLLGGYTTFSTWMVEAQRLGEDAAWAPMWLYLLGSLAAGLAAAGAGWLAGGALG
jgi:CrcB protein